MLVHPQNHALIVAIRSEEAQYLTNQYNMKQLL